MAYFLANWTQCSFYQIYNQCWKETRVTISSFYFLVGIVTIVKSLFFLMPSLQSPKMLSLTTLMFYHGRKKTKKLSPVSTVIFILGGLFQAALSFPQFCFTIAAPVPGYRQYSLSFDLGTDWQSLPNTFPAVLPNNIVLCRACFFPTQCHIMKLLLYISVINMSLGSINQNGSGRTVFHL